MTAAPTVGETPRRQTAVPVVLCADLKQHASLDLGDLQSQLGEALPGTTVGIASDLCSRPRQIRELADRTGSRRLVLGLCGGTYDRRALQVAIRKSDLDIFAVEVVAIPPTTRPPSLEAVKETVVRFRAAAARLDVFVDTAPEQLRPKLLSEGAQLSRRSLFALPPIMYDALPSIDQDACLGRQSCSLCARACPARAIAPSGGSLVVERDGCISCGVCVSTCPVGAVSFPGANLAQYEAELNVVLSAPRRPIAFACRSAMESHGPIQANSSTESTFRNVEVPCLGTVTVGWILQTLAAGAPAVKLVSCGIDCRADRWPIMRSRVDYTRRLLAELGEDDPSERVQILAANGDVGEVLPPPEPQHVDGVPNITLAQPRASAEALSQLQRRYGAESVELSHPESPLGFVRLREETCTTCGTCADVCPTGALDVTDQALTREVSFDPTLCIACGRCASFCPEAAFDTLAVEHITRTGELARGRRTLARSTQTPCERCGRPVAPSAMLDRIEAMLEGSDASDELLRTLRRLCSDCRGLTR